MEPRHRLYVSSKWEKHSALMNELLLKDALPRMERLSLQSLRDLLEEFDTVYVKPEHGMGGRGVMKVSRSNKQLTLDQQGYPVRNFSTLQALYRVIRHRKRGRRYVAQQGIELIRNGDRLIDFRVLLMKPGSVWHCMGAMGKMAPPAQITTNRTRGGEPITVRHALATATDFDEDRIEKIEYELIAISRHVAGALSESYPGLRCLGLDLAVDQDGKVWLLEANTAPGVQLFKHHENDKLYAKISHFRRKINSRRRRRPNSKKKI
ncbi:hypothetical protein DUZ99_04430 [Xylanibacillus composti]|uniref:YheC/YheD family protein n=1 Tax=Xylanibacillus composti TaxID=1572762 RepID=A0A8J4H2J8_9BACL|nr:YheC/YheD family protein [Xylanibacillus composti]MDT9724235.1 hypothetical protein [Xylanibacillus composti]GIQ68247.1 YheC/YheD family protein [Xylanibacillus composti]